MRIEEINFCVLRGPGTNCDQETKHAIQSLGAKAEIIHINQFLRGKRDISSYNALIIPGGFSFGDHIRSGAILGKMLGKNFSKAMKEFVGEEKPILGICNGFQILVEAGILPGFDGISKEPQAALATNASSKFEDRWVYLKTQDHGKCIFTKKINDLIRMPVAHGEGRFILPPGKEEEYIRKLEENGQIVFRYALKDGALAMGRYPENPNGSIADIAGICDPSGIVLGLMPHPERAFHRIMYPDWTRTGLKGKGDGFRIFKNMVEYVRKRF